MKKITLNSETKKHLNSIGKIGIIVISIIAGYLLSEMHFNYKKNTTKADQTEIPKTLNDIKVYMNNNELMLMDTKTGRYQLYDNEVIQTIFNIKANQMFNENNKKN